MLLRQLESCIRVDCVSELFPEGAFLLVVWQLEKVETGRGCRESVDGVTFPEGQETSKHRTNCVTVIIVFSNLDTPEKNTSFLSFVPNGTHSCDL